VPGILCDVSNAILDGFTRAEWETMMGFLKRMVANAEALKDVAAQEPASDAPPADAN